MADPREKTIPVEVGKLEPVAAPQQDGDANLSAVFEASFDPLAAHDGVVILRVNDAFAATFGYCVNELLGMQVVDLVPSDSHDAILRPTTSGFLRGGEAVGLRKDGATFVTQVRTRHLFADGKTVHLVALRNVSDNPLAEVQLRQSEQRYRDLVQNLQVGVVAHGPDSSIILSNPMASELLGLTPDQLRGKTAVDPAWCFIREDHSVAPLAEYPVVRAMASEEPVSGLVLGILRPDRREATRVQCDAHKVRDDDGQLRQIVVTFFDISDRKRAMEAVRASEERHRSILHTAMDGFWLLAPDGRLTEVNDAYAEMSGYRTDELLTMRVADLEVSASVDPPVAHWTTVTTADEGRFETRHRRKDGSLFDVEVCVQNRRSEGGVLVAFVRDITERKQAARALKLKNLVFDVSLAANSIAGLDGTITEVNTAFLRIWGYADKSEVVGRPLGEFLNAPSEVEAIMTDLADTGQWEGDYAGKRKDGSTFVAHGLATAVRDARCTVVGYQSAVLDMTETRRAEAAVRETQDRLQAIVDNSTMVVFLKDLDGRTLLVNRRFEEVFQIKRADAIGRLDSELFPPELAVRMRQADLNALQSPSPIEVQEVIPHAEGLHTYTTIKFALLAEDAKPYAVCGIAMDITDRVLAEQRRRDMETRLAHHQRLESIGTLASGVAHEINNPINVIMNLAELISEDAEQGSTIAKNARRIVGESERIADIVKNLLAFARLERELHSLARIEDIVSAAVALLARSLAKDRILLEVILPPNLPRVRCRSQQIQQVLVNLIANARDALNARFPAADDNKRLRIEARVTLLDGVRAVQLSVEDHGSGIPEDVKHRIFEPFFTTKPRGVGTGLGLSISHGIVEEHHGTIAVSSEPGQLTRFDVTLLADNGWRIEPEGDAPPDGNSGG